MGLTAVDKWHVEIQALISLEVAGKKLRCLFCKQMETRKQRIKKKKGFAFNLMYIFYERNQ